MALWAPPPRLGGAGAQSALGMPLLWMTASAVAVVRSLLALGTPVAIVASAVIEAGRGRTSAAHASA